MRLLSPDSGDCPSTVDARTWYLELWELTNDRRTDEFHTFLLHSSVRQDIRGGRYMLICAGVWTVRLYVVTTSTFDHLLVCLLSYYELNNQLPFCTLIHYNI